MAKKWFKVWESVITSPEFTELPLEKIAQWVLLGTYIAKYGKNGKVEISKQILENIIREKFDFKNDNDKTIVIILPHISIKQNDNDKIIVIMENWSKYQIDSTSYERLKRFRSKNRQNLQKNNIDCGKPVDNSVNNSLNILENKDNFEPLIKTHNDNENDNEKILNHLKNVNEINMLESFSEKKLNLISKKNNLLYKPINILKSNNIYKTSKIYKNLNNNINNDSYINKETYNISNTNIFNNKTLNNNKNNINNNNLLLFNTNSNNINNNINNTTTKKKKNNNIDNKNKIANEIIARYCELFKESYGKNPVITKRDAGIAQRLTDIPNIIEIIEKFFQSKDKFILNARHSFCILESQINKLLVEGIDTRYAGIDAWLKSKESEGINE